ncbi:MAG: YmfL family putative regulatory protein [Massilia sp.]
MKLRESYLAMIKAMSGGWDAMCGALAINRDYLENRVYERKGTVLSVETALAMQSFSRTTYFAEAVATASGGTFLKLPIEADGCANEDIFKKFRELAVQMGTLTKDFEDAIAGDDTIDKRERAKLEADEALMHKILAEMVALMKRVYCKPDPEDA